MRVAFQTFTEQLGAPRHSIGLGISVFNLTEASPETLDSVRLSPGFFQKAILNPFSFNVLCNGVHYNPCIFNLLCNYGGGGGLVPSNPLDCSRLRIALR